MSLQLQSYEMATSSRGSQTLLCTPSRRSSSITLSPNTAHVSSPYDTEPSLTHPLSDEGRRNRFWPDICEGSREGVIREVASQRREHRLVPFAAWPYCFPSRAAPSTFFAEPSVVLFPSELSASISRSLSNIGLLTEIFGWSRASYVTSSPVTYTYHTRNMTR